MYRHIQSPAYYRKFRHIQAYSRPVKTYSAILNPVIFRILDIDILRTRPRQMLAYLERCVTLVY